MKTSRQWWEETKADKSKILNWLERQYVGEVTAANRMMDVVKNYELDLVVKSELMLIASQEMRHASWIKDLLVEYNVPIPSLENAEKRYWSKVLPQVSDVDSAFAAAAHAEKMRLERIRVIAEDGDSSINKVFKKIEKDELFHAYWFDKHASEKALKDAEKHHLNGLKELQLTLINEF